MSRQVLCIRKHMFCQIYIYVSPGIMQWCVCLARYIFMRMSRQVLYIFQCHPNQISEVRMCVLTAQDAHGCKCVRARLYARASFVVRLCMHVFRVIYECVRARAHAYGYECECVVCFACVCFLYVCVSVCVMCVSVSVCGVYGVWCVCVCPDSRKAP